MLAWLSNDSLAIDALLNEAERFRFALPNTPSEAPPLTTIYQLSAFADEHPARDWLARHEGEIADATYHAEGVTRELRNLMLGSKKEGHPYAGVEWLYGKDTSLPGGT